MPPTTRSKKAAATAKKPSIAKKKIPTEQKRYVWRNARDQRGAGMRDFLATARRFKRTPGDISKFDKFRERGHVNSGTRQNAYLFEKKITYKKQPRVKTKVCKYGKLARGNTYVCIKNPDHKSQGIMGFKPRKKVMQQRGRTKK